MISVLLSAFNLNAEVLKSPNGNLVVHFDLKDGIPYYKVEYKNMAVINESSLGLELKDAPALLDGFELVEAQRGTFDETWEPVWGEWNSMRSYYN